MTNIEEGKEYQARRRGASKGPGWGVRIHEADGSSELNSLSLGNVMVYDAKADAERDACDSLETAKKVGAIAPHWLGRRYTVEWVEAGAWSPSAYDAALLALMPYAQTEATKGNENARAAVNNAKALLSDYAPALLKRPV